MPENIPEIIPADTVIQRVQFKKLLGRGGFGATYLAIDQHYDNMWVAVKEYYPSDFATKSLDEFGNVTMIANNSASEKDFKWGLQKFQDEAHFLAALDHDAIVRVRRFFEANGTAYIIMDFVEGWPLSEWIKQAKGEALSTEFTENTLNRLLDGLELVHQSGVVHRDIKPANILIRKDDYLPVLIDFGAARLTSAIRSRDFTNVTSKGFSPVEQYSVKSEIGPWSDIYALGCVGYQCLTGERPPSAVDRQQNDTLVPLGKRENINAPDTLITAIDRALELDPAKRPRSIAEWRRIMKGEVPADKKRSDTAAAKAQAEEALAKEKKLLQQEIEAQEEVQRTGLVLLSMALVVLVIAAYIVYLAVGNGRIT